MKKFQNKNNYSKGISLLVLVITIIAVIIIAGAVILNLTKNNPIDNAKKAGYLSDLDSFKNELMMYKSSLLSNTVGEFDATKLQANEVGVTYTGPGTIDTTNKTIKDIITGLNNSTKYENEFEILNGELAYKGIDAKKQDWTLSFGVMVNSDKTNVAIATAEINPIKAGNNVEYTIRVYSKVGVKDIGDLTGKVVVTDEEGTVLATQPTITFGTVINLENEKQIPTIINTTGLINGSYKLKLLADSVQNNVNLYNTETLSSNGFTVDSSAPQVPQITASPTSWTSGDVTVSITYPTDSNKNEYSYDTITWNTYTNPIIVSANNTTIYSRATDLAGNESSLSTVTIANIDKTVPTVIFGTNGANNVQTASTTVNVTDISGSGVNSSTLQYVWDTQNTTTPTSGWTMFTNGATLTKSTVTATYYLWVKASDNSGNSIVEKTNAFTIDNTVPTSPAITPSTTAWTNGSVTVTITYPSDAFVKQYSTDGSTWYTYTAGLIINLNNTTVYAKATDAAENQSTQSTLTITNIDKTVPTVTFGTNGATNVQTASTTIMVSDTGGSGVLISSLQYVWDTQNEATPTSGWTTFTNGATLTKSTVTATYYLWIKASDNAGNSIVEKTNAFAIDSTAPIAPTFIPSTTAWTSGNVTVTVTYPSDASTKQYSTNGSTWYTYTSAIVVSTNNTTVYARCYDAAGNQSSQSTLTITNIDKTVPTVTFGTNGGTNLSTASTVVTVSDSSESGVLTSSLQYVWDTQNEATPTSGWTIFTNGATLTKTGATITYYLWIKAGDNAGNSIVTKSNGFYLNNPFLVESLLSYSNFDNVTVKDVIKNSVTGTNYTITSLIRLSKNKLKVGAASCYFPGVTGEKLNQTVPSLNLGTSDFTVQLWVYPETQVCGYPLIFGGESNSNLCFFLADGTGGGKISLRIANNNLMINTGKVYTPNVWTHYAIVRKDGIFTIYENGINIGTTSSFKTSAVNFSDLAIGGNNQGSNVPYKGYMDDFSICNYALYTSNFTPPVTPQSNANLVYSSFDDIGNYDIKDLTTNNLYTRPSGTVKINLTANNSKFGGASCYFPGITGERLNQTVPSLNLGTSDFTVQLWAYPETQVCGYPLLFGGESNSNLCFFLADGTGGGKISLRIANNNLMINTGKVYTPNVWTHYAIVRKDGIFTIYENGINIGTTSSFKTSAVNFSDLAIGGNNQGSNVPYKGYIDDFAIFNYAVYTSNFTPLNRAVE